MFVIKLIELAATQLQINKYVVFYDATSHEDDGVYIGGILELTDDVGKAKRFDTIQDAIKYQRQDPGCSCHMRRMDGAFNRPLTAFTVEFQQYRVIVEKKTVQSEKNLISADVEIERIK